MQVLIVRHAIAVDRGQGHGRDEDRALTARGKARMKEAAAGLARLLPRPDAIYTSPLVRALETARLLSRAFRGSPAPDVSDVLSPGHGPADVTRWLATLSGPEMVALVGHEPSLSELIAHLCVGGPALQIDLKKGGAALIELGEHPGKARGVLHWFATPRLLRLAGGGSGGGDAD